MQRCASASTLEQPQTLLPGQGFGDGGTAIALVTRQRSKGTKHRQDESVAIAGAQSWRPTSFATPCISQRWQVVQSEGFAHP